MHLYVVLILNSKHFTNDYNNNNNNNNNNLYYLYCAYSMK